jgi:lysophospholipase L1-like esterase
MLASVLPVSDYHKTVNPRFEMTRQRPSATIVALNAWLKDFCAQNNYVYVDYYTAMVDNAGFLQADLADDGLHPNAKGYRVMAPIAQSEIDRALTRAPKKKRGRRS